MHQVRDIENFCKLFKVPCSVHRLFSHNVDALVAAGDDKLLHQLELYNKREELVSNMYQDKKTWYMAVKQHLDSIEASNTFLNGLHWMHGMAPPRR